MRSIHSPSATLSAFLFLSLTVWLVASYPAHLLPPCSMLSVHLRFPSYASKTFHDHDIQFPSSSTRISDFTNLTFVSFTYIFPSGPPPPPSLVNNTPDHFATLEGFMGSVEIKKIICTYLMDGYDSPPLLFFWFSVWVSSWITDKRNKIHDPQ